MQRRRTGLQKDFAAIFEGVWVPKKPEPKRPPADVPTPEQYRGQIEQIERIIASMTCSKDFECFKSGFQKLCKVENIGDGKIGLEAFKELVNNPNFKNHPAYLETPGTKTYAYNLKKLRSLVK